MDNLLVPGFKRLSVLGIAEGISLLVLLFIAMPMKYFIYMPVAVKITGWLHGILFVAFVAVLFFTCVQNKWSPKIFVLGFIAAFVPFGTFIFDSYLKKQQVR